MNRELILKDFYEYIQRDDIVADVKNLLSLDLATTGTGPTSVILIKESESLLKKNILDLKGSGREVWKGVDAQEYIDQMRSEWDNEG